MKILEKDLNEKIKIFKNKNVMVVFDDIFEAKFYMNNIHIHYNYNKGILHIKEETSNNELNLNLVFAYLIDFTDNVLHIGLDNSIDFEMRII